MKSLFICILLLISSLGKAYELGEIISQNSRKTAQGISNEITFYRGDIALRVGDELRINQNGVKYKIKVSELKDKIAIGEITHIALQPGSYLSLIPLTGQRVILEIKPESISFLSFNLGLNKYSSVSDYSGSGNFLGINVGGHINNELIWDLMIQADSYGKNSTQTEIRRSAYLIGVGKDFGSLNLIGYLGTIDTMIITDSASQAGTYNPYTGNYINTAIQHDNQFGFSLSVLYRFIQKPVDKSQEWGWSLTPRINYTNTFQTQFGSYVSYGISIEMLTDSI